ncbi:MAG: ferredoxin [Candidatus Omnitrophica bacterium]|nr:ferredoxin [Candidatus Omnitrophota bacterium]
MISKRVELNIPLDFKDEPILYYMIKNYDIIPNIIEASFSTELGWVLLDLRGENEEVEKLFNFLKEKGVEIKFR